MELLLGLGGCALGIIAIIGIGAAIGWFALTCLGFVLKAIYQIIKLPFKYWYISLSILAVIAIVKIFI